MANLCVPPIIDGDEDWPSLGDQLIEWLERNGRYGPGELQGEEYRCTPDFKAQLRRAYQVYPKGHRLAGRRRFKRVCFEERKGTAKTERAMLVAFAESHPLAPVRCVGFERDGTPTGRGVVSPYIPIVSYTLEQTDDLGYNVLRSIIADSPLANDYDIGLERILLLDERGREAGKIVPLASSPNARDGARTTFQHFDEPHRMTLPRLVKSHATMVENSYKRVGADAWTLETTTAGALGEESVAEATREYAEAVDRGEVDDPRLFFFSRFAPLDMPLETPDEVRAALLEASGPNASWSGDIDALVSRFFEPKVDRSYYRRVWLNQWVPGGDLAFDPGLWAELAAPTEVARGTQITLGFDGSVRHDATALVATVLETGYQFVLGVWQRPANAPEDWEVPTDLVDLAVCDAFDRYKVVLMYADPPHWGDWLDAWAGKFGADRVKSWWTNRNKAMAFSLAGYRDAMLERAVSHDGSAVFADHVSNAYKLDLGIVDDQDVPLWVVRKERRDSPRKIDAAMAGCLSWEARGDAIAAGALKQRKPRTFGSR